MCLFLSYILVRHPYCVGGMGYPLVNRFSGRLRLYGVRHMVKDHSDSEKENPLPPHRLLFTINSKGSFICTIPQTGYHIPRPFLHQSWSTGWNEK